MLFTVTTAKTSAAVAPASAEDSDVVLLVRAKLLRMFCCASARVVASELRACKLVLTAAAAAVTFAIDVTLIAAAGGTVATGSAGTAIASTLVWMPVAAVINAANAEVFTFEIDDLKELAAESDGALTVKATLMPVSILRRVALTLVTLTYEAATPSCAAMPASKARCAEGTKSDGELKPRTTADDRTAYRTFTAKPAGSTTWGMAMDAAPTYVRRAGAA